MQCNYCGADNPEKAVFCKKCGRRLDGMAICSACGALTPADGEFCVNCGSNRNAPVYSMPLRFPAASAASAGKANKAARAQKAASPAGSPAKEKGRGAVILGAISFWCAAAAALVGMIFVFLIGCTLGVNGVSSGVDTGYDIFYFFGDAYNGLDALTGTAETSALVGAVVGTMCACAAMAGTLACFILTVVRLVKILTKKTDKGISAPAFATGLAYICGAALLLLCVAQNSTIAGVSTGITANGATVAGIIICAVLLVASVVLRAIADGINCGVRQYVVNIVFSVLAAVFVFVALGMLGCGAVSVGVSTSGLEISATYGISSFFGQLSSMSLNVGGTGSQAAREFNAFYNSSTAMMMVLLIAAIAFGVMVVLSVPRLLSSLGGGLSKKTLVFTGVAGACAVVAGIIMCVASSQYAEQLGSSYSANVGSAAVAIAFGALVCIGTAAYAVLFKKQQQSDAPAEDETV